MTTRNDETGHRGQIAADRSVHITECVCKFVCPYASSVIEALRMASLLLLSGKTCVTLVDMAQKRLYTLFASERK